MIRSTERYARKELLPHQEEWNRKVTDFINVEDRDAVIRTILRAIKDKMLTPPEASTLLDILGEPEPDASGWRARTTFAQRWITLTVAQGLAHHHLLSMMDVVRLD